MKRTHLGRVAAAAISLALVAAACGDDSGKTTTSDAPGGSTAAGGVTCSGVTLAFLGALSGDNGNLGKNMINGAQIAFDEFNLANPNCQVKFDTSFDSQGDPDQATPLADKIVGDASIIGLVGPGFSGESKATLPKFESASLPVISPSATNALLSTNGWKMFHRVLANDDKQGPGIVTYIKKAGAKKVGVIDDASEYGKGLADNVRAGLGALKVADAAIVKDAADYSAAVTAMKAAGVDWVFFGGYYAEAAKLITQLRDGGVTAQFISGDGSLDVGFIDGAGAKGDGAVLTATGAPPDVNPTFATAFNAKFGTPPALYSPESYDCAKIFLDGIAAGKTTRADMAAFVSAYDAPGITKQLKFDATGEPAGEAVFYSIVEGGKLVAKGLIKA
jgi:branched-chain amino acid transport system substrate-binding protein